MQSSLQFNLLLITDKMSPKHPERMRKFRAAAELYKGKVSPNRETEGLLGRRKPVISAMNGEGIISSVSYESKGQVVGKEDYLDN